MGIFRNPKCPACRREAAFCICHSARATKALKRSSVADKRKGKGK